RLTSPGASRSSDRRLRPPGSRLPRRGRRSFRARLPAPLRPLHPWPARLESPRRRHRLRQRQRNRQGGPSMEYGIYTAILHDRPLADALTVIRDLGLDAAEINVSRFLPPVHMPTTDDILTSADARDEYLNIFP